MRQNRSLRQLKTATINLLLLQLVKIFLLITHRDSVAISDYLCSNHFVCHANKFSKKDKDKCEERRPATRSDIATATTTTMRAAAQNQQASKGFSANKVVQ